MTGANRHDGAKLADVLDGKIVEPPQDWEGKQHHKTIINHGYIAYVKPRGEEAQEKDKNPLYKPLRWIVEVSHSWFNRFKKKLKERFEKKVENFLALHHLAAAIITLRKIKSYLRISS